MNRPSFAPVYLLRTARAGLRRLTFCGALCLPALAAAVDRSPAVMQALSQYADQAVRTGRWLVVNVQAEHPGDLLWRRATSRDPEPKLCAALAAVAARATAIPPPVPSQSGTAAPAPRQILAGVADLTRRQRPMNPADRPSPGIG